MTEIKLDVSGLPESKYDKGHLLFEEGKPGENVYVLKDGGVRIVAGGSEICEVREKHTIFGEISVLLETAASANVEVVEPSTFYVIKDLKRFVQERPDAALHMSQVLAQRVVDMNKYYVGIKQELMKLEDNPAAKASKRLWDFVVKMDRFWGREVL